MEHCLKIAAEWVGAGAFAEPTDVSISEEHEFMQDHVYDALKEACSAGHFDAHISAPSFRTWSAARHRPGGPLPLRLRSELYWRRTHTQRQRELMDGDTILMRRSNALSAIVASWGGVFAVENFADRGRPPGASTFVAEEAAILRSSFQAEEVVFDQCCVGLRHRKPTQWPPNPQEVVKAFADQRCRYPRGS